MDFGARFFKGWRRDGAVAQLGERLLCKQEVVGSIPSGSTRSWWFWLLDERNSYSLDPLFLGSVSFGSRLFHIVDRKECKQELARWPRPAAGLRPAGGIGPLAMLWSLAMSDS